MQITVTVNDAAFTREVEPRLLLIHFLRDQLGLTAVGARQFAAPQAEEFLRGAPATEESFARAGEIAAQHCRPVSDQRGPAHYKRHLAGELTRRALRTALARTAGTGRATGQGA